MNIAIDGVTVFDSTPPVVAEKPQSIMTGKDAVEHLGVIANSSQEHIMIVALNRQSQIVGSKIVFTGGIDKSVVDLRLVFKFALLRNAVAIIMAHNHPSGGIKPSDEDIAITRKVSKAGRILGIDLYDHIIVAGDDWKSMRADENIPIWDRDFDEGGEDG